MNQLNGHFQITSEKYGSRPLIYGYWIFNFDIQGMLVARISFCTFVLNVLVFLSIAIQDFDYGGQQNLLLLYVTCNVYLALRRNEIWREILVFWITISKIKRKNHFSIYILEFHMCIADALIKHNVNRFIKVVMNWFDSVCYTKNYLSVLFNMKLI